MATTHRTTLNKDSVEFNVIYSITEELEEESTFNKEIEIKKITYNRKDITEFCEAMNLFEEITNMIIH